MKKINDLLTIPLLLAALLAVAVTTTNVEAGPPDKVQICAGLNSTIYVPAIAAQKMVAAGKAYYGPCHDCIVLPECYPDCYYPLYLDPVCGCNGEYYINEYEAQANGVTSWTDGGCQ